jgi:hypothetical protein
MEWTVPLSRQLNRHATQCSPGGVRDVSGLRTRQVRQATEIVEFGDYSQRGAAQPAKGARNRTLQLEKKEGFVVVRIEWLGGRDSSAVAATPLRRDRLRVSEASPRVVGARSAPT